MHQQVEVVGLGDLAEGVAGGRADQGIEPGPALPLQIRLADALRQCLVGLLAPLILGLLCAQLGTELFADGRLRLQIAQGRGQLFSVQVSVVLGLMLVQALLALLQQDLGLLDRGFAALQLQAQLADLFVAVAQQLRKACVVEFRVQGTPVGDLALQCLPFAVQRLLALLLRLEFGCQLDELALHFLQLLAGRGLCLARLLEGLFQLCLPGFGTRLFTQQRTELLLGAVQLCAEQGVLLLRGLGLLQPGQLAVLFHFQAWLALLLLVQFFTLARQLLQALGHLLVELEEGRRRFMAQAFKDGAREQVGESGKLFVQA